MKNIISAFLVVLVMVSCKNKETNVEDKSEEKQEIAYASFGDKIVADDALSSSNMTEQYKNLKVGDSLEVKMIAKVNEVCQAKGCWMTLDLDNGEYVMVKFKDYGFFMPKNIAGMDVIINGKAFVSEVPVNEQHHYAEDAGKSTEEIALITEPKRTYSFEADGVLLIEE